MNAAVKWGVAANMVAADISASYCSAFTKLGGV